MESIINLFFGIIALIMIITFFVMAGRLKKIENILDILRQLELRKPENSNHFKCENCGKEFNLSVLAQGLVECPGCRQLVK
jgi:hypothetical protein